jgi:hypothetical protein
MKLYMKLDMKLDMNLDMKLYPDLGTNNGINKYHIDINGNYIKELFSYAVMHSYTSVLKLLLSLGYKIDSESYFGCFTNLQLAVFIGNLKVVKILLDNGANTHENLENEDIEFLALEINDDIDGTNGTYDYYEDSSDDNYEKDTIHMERSYKKFDILTIALLYAYSEFNDYIYQACFRFESKFIEELDRETYVESHCNESDAIDEYDNSGLFIEGNDFGSLSEMFGINYCDPDKRCVMVKLILESMMYT